MYLILLSIDFVEPFISPKKKQQKNCTKFLAKSLPRKTNIIIIQQFSTVKWFQYSSVAMTTNKNSLIVFTLMKRVENLFCY